MTRPRVLLVEDEALVAMMMEDLLHDLGCEVVGSFGRLSAAIDWLAQAQQAPDGAVLDVNLGGGDMVFPLAHALRERGVPFAFATGYAALPEDGFGEVPVLQKPVDEAKLWPVIQAFRARAGKPAA